QVVADIAEAGVDGVPGVVAVVADGGGGGGGGAGGDDDADGLGEDRVAEVVVVVVAVQLRVVQGAGAVVVQVVADLRLTGMHRRPGVVAVVAGDVRGAAVGGAGAERRPARRYLEGRVTEAVAVIVAAAVDRAHAVVV